MTVHHAIQPAKEAAGVKVPIIAKDSVKSTALHNVPRAVVSGRNRENVVTCFVPAVAQDPLKKTA